MRISLVALTLAFTAFVAVAQSPLTFDMGPRWGEDVGTDAAGGAVRTDIDLLGPALANGRISRVSFGWSENCRDAAKIKFFRRSGDTLALLAERGPYSYPPVGQWDWQVSPPVDVMEGDLIGISRVGDCGSPVITTAYHNPPAGYVQYSGDVSGIVKIAEGTPRSGALSINATGQATEFTAGILPVVGSGSGQMGSRWRTEVQLVARKAGPMGGTQTTGRLVFHRAGVPGLSTDPSVSFSLGYGETRTFPDVVAAIGETGFGSLDVVTISGAAPEVLARIVNDAGSAGTHGAVEQVIDPRSASLTDESEWDWWGGWGWGWDNPDCWCWGNSNRFPGTPVLERNMTGFLITPESPSTTRFNVGVRALFTGATIAVTLRDSDGLALRTTTRRYGPNSFEQVSAEEFAGAPIGANQSIKLTVNEGMAIVYGVATDNETNDPAMQRVTAALFEQGAMVRTDSTTVDSPGWILPVVGPPKGTTGDEHWSTSLQLLNQHDSAVSGRILFHAEETQASSTDAAVQFSLAPGEVESISDIAAAAGQSGRGSVSVLADVGSPVPLVVARVYSGSADRGMRGTGVEPVEPRYGALDCSSMGRAGLFGTPMLEQLTTAYFATPTTAETAFSIGVRTTAKGAKLMAELYDPAGQLLKRVEKVYPAHWSQQVSATRFFDSAVGTNQAIRIVVTEGELMMYAVTVDVKTNDPAIHYVRGGWNRY